MKTLRAVVCRVGQPPVVEQIGSGLESFQALVGGSIQMVPVPDENGRRSLALYLNEEGKLIGLPPNLLWLDGTRVHDVLVGDVFIVGPADRNGDDTGLTDKQVRWVIEKLLPRVFPPVKPYPAGRGRFGVN